MLKRANQLIQGSFTLPGADPPTDLSAGLISSTTVLVSWQPPQKSGPITGYSLNYTDGDEEENEFSLHHSVHSYPLPCRERTNITLKSLSWHISSIPVTIEFFARKFKERLVTKSSPLSDFETLYLMCVH